MPTILGTSGNDTWTVVNPGNFVIDGLAGIDTLNFGTEPRASFIITQGTNGTVLVDTVSGASGIFHATLFNFEKLVFNSNKDSVDLAALFGDIIAPTVVSFNPVAQATDFVPNKNIVITFSEAIVRGTGSITLKTADGAIVATYDAASSNNLTFSGSTLSIDPTLDLSFNTSYTIAIGAGTVKDLKGNAYAGSNSYGFTTAIGVVINGTAGNDTLVGSAGKDLINGGAGNDLITGGAADDSLTGGDGLDTAIYAGKKIDYLVLAAGTDFTVQDKVGLDGIDSLIQVERLQFSDGAIALDILGSAGQAYRVYQAAFDRKPDLGGLSFWIKAMDSGFSLDNIAAEFFKSAEFQALYGINPSNTTLITNFYKNVLHREPDQGGLDFWVNHLNAGHITPTVALTSFSESPENQALVIGSIQNGIDYNPL